MWAQLHDHVGELAIEDPANPNGNNLSELFNDTVKDQLSSTGETTLKLIEKSGWEAVFGKLQTQEQQRIEALTRISVAAPVRPKPWFSGN